MTWLPRETNRNWVSIASSADGSKLIAAVSGGKIYTSLGSTNDGLTWVPHETDRDWECVASSADGSKLVAAVWGGRIYTSTDYGVTWFPHETNRNWDSVASSADGTRLVAAAFDGYIYTSVNSGATWTPREGQRFWHSVASSADGRHLVASSNEQISEGIPARVYVSADYGLTWTWRNVVGNDYEVASSADGTKLVAVSRSSALPYGLAYMSTDSGVTWTPAQTDAQLWQSVASSADGNHLIAAETAGHLYTYTAPFSVSGAQGSQATLQYLGNGQWTSLKPQSTTPGSVSAQAIASVNQNAVANTSYAATSASLTTITLPDTADVGDVIQVSGAGAGGWTVRLDDEPGTWTARGPERQWAGIVSSADGNTLVAGGASLHALTDRGVNWQASETPGNSLACSDDASHIYAVYGTNVFRVFSGFGTGSWPVCSPTNNPGGWAVACSADGTNVVAAGPASRIYTSTNSGGTWTPSETNRNWTLVASSSNGSNLVAAGWGEQIYTSTNAGLTWTPRDSVRSWVSLASSDDGSRLVALARPAGGTQVYTSSDYGVTWTPHAIIASAFWSRLASSADGTRLAVVDGSSGGNVYTSTDYGTTWWLESIPDAPPTHQWRGIACSADGRQLAVTDGYGVNGLDGGRIYISDSATVISGSQGDAVTLQYLGSGKWDVAGARPDGLWTVDGPNLSRSEGKVSMEAADIGTAEITSATVGDTSLYDLFTGFTQPVPDQNFPLLVRGAVSGIHVDVVPGGLPLGDHQNKYMKFTVNGTVRGSIQGQDMTDLLASSEYKWYSTMKNLHSVFQAAIVVAEVAQADFGEAAVHGAEFVDIIAEWNHQLTTMQAELGVRFQSGAGDYAEWLEMVDPTETIRPAEIVGMTGGRIAKATAGADRCMIASTAPIVAGNAPSEGEEDRFRKIAFIGQVPAKVRGVVHVGDYVLASGLNDGCGIAMSPDQMSLADYRRIAGVAWSASTAPHREGLINVAVGLNQNDLVDKLDHQQQQIDSLISYLKSKDPEFAMTPSPGFKPATSTGSLPQSSTAFTAPTVPAAAAALDFSVLKKMVKEHPERLEALLNQTKQELARRGIDYSHHAEIVQVLDLQYYTDWANSSEPSLRPPLPGSRANPSIR